MRVSTFLSRPANFMATAMVASRSLRMKRSAFSDALIMPAHELWLFLNQLIGRGHRSPRVFHFFADERQFSETGGNSDVAFRRRCDDAVDRARHQSAHPVTAAAGIDKIYVPIGI